MTEVLFHRLKKEQGKDEIIPNQTVSYNKVENIIYERYAIFIDKHVYHSSYFSSEYFFFVDYLLFTQDFSLVNKIPLASWTCASLCHSFELDLCLTFPILQIKIFKLNCYWLNYLAKTSPLQVILRLSEPSLQSRFLCTNLC